MCVEGIKLRIENINVTVKKVYIVIDGINALTAAVHLTVYSHKVLEFLLHLSLVCTKSLLLLGNILLYLITLLFQTVDAVAFSILFCGSLLGGSSLS